MSFRHNNTAFTRTYHCLEFFRRNVAVHIVLSFCIDEQGPAVDAKCSGKAGRDTAYLLPGLLIEQVLVVTHSRVLVA